MSFGHFQSVLVLVLIRQLHYMYHFNLEEGDFPSLPLGAVEIYKEKGLR